MSAVLEQPEQPDDAVAFHPVAFPLCKPTQPERLYSPQLPLELLAVVDALKCCCLNCSTSSSSYRPASRADSSRSSSGTSVIFGRDGSNRLAEEQHRVLHIPGRTNTTDCLNRKRFPDGPGLVPHTG